MSDPLSTARPPLVISCQGGTRLAGLAGDVAAALDELGVTETARDLDQAVDAARAGRRVVALDGCASACRARLLDARGARVHAALTVAELGARGETLGPADRKRLVAEAAARLRSGGTASRPARRPPLRPARPPLVPRTKWLHVVDDYLLALDALGSTTVECGALAADAPALAAHVSRLLAVSRAAAGQMLGRLESSGLVERGAHKELLLTPSGRVAADRAVRRHRLLERFANDFLGYQPAECHEQARVLAGAFDDDAVERLRLRLGDPARCPHGWPIDPRQAREESRELATLSALAKGERATVVGLAEHDGHLFAHLAERGIMPGTTLTVVRVRSATESITVRLRGTTRRLSAAAAAEVFVRRQAP